MFTTRMCVYIYIYIYTQVSLFLSLSLSFSLYLSLSISLSLYIYIHTYIYIHSAPVRPAVRIHPEGLRSELSRAHDLVLADDSAPLRKSQARPNGSLLKWGWSNNCNCCKRCNKCKRDDHFQGKCVCHIDAILGTPFTRDPFGRASKKSSGYTRSSASGKPSD